MPVVIDLEFCAWRGVVGIGIVMMECGVGGDDGSCRDSRGGFWGGGEF